MIGRILIFIILTLSTNQLLGQQQPFVTLPEQLTDQKYAEWITMPGIEGNEYGVYYFRKTFSLENIPEKYSIHVSGDNRYRLYVNGKMVCWGPAVGDLTNWNYETVDIAKRLKPGINTVAAQVWNMGEFRGARQISNRTAFIVQGSSTEERLVNTNKSWKVTRDPGYFPIAQPSAQVGGGYIAGATDSLLFSHHPWGWESVEYDDSQWDTAQELGKGNHDGLNTWKGTSWLLKPRSIPLMEQVYEDTPKVLEIQGLDIDPEEISETLHLKIPKYTKVEVLLDNEQLTMGFPQLVTSKGKNAKIKIQYQEALFDENNRKGDRDIWKHKSMKGYYDVFVSDGGMQRAIEPLWIRVYRYVKIYIETQEEGIEIHRFNNLFTAYPFEQKGSFSSNDKAIDHIWAVSWRTVRLCALESYMDCPYYEQLQYIGDTRIQALISLYVAGDDRLAKNAIAQFYHSMQPMGLTKSSHPQRDIQIIPPFSLLYISMVHDYFMLRDDEAFIRQYLPGIQFILSWFVTRINEDGMLGPLPYWNHIDGGVAEFAAGSPPGIVEGNSAHMSILLAHSIKDAVEMFEYFGYGCDTVYYNKIADQLIEATMQYCWDESKGLIAETPNKQMFSQHTNAMAILTDVFDEDQSRQVAKKMIEDTTLAQATLYFNFYIFQALKKAGLGNEVLNQLDKWKLFLDNGFTTFPEHGIDSRSDCHAWSSHPMYDFLNITCGVAPASPGFQTIEITPQLGELQEVKGVIFHPLGNITITYQKLDTSSDCLILLPEGLSGTLVWKGKNYPLESGENLYDLD